MRRKTVRVLLSAAGVFFIIVPFRLEAARIVLDNGDLISGTLTRQSDESVIVDTEAMGEVTIQRTHIDRIEEDNGSLVQIQQKEAPPASLWERTVSVGYFKSTGNTKKSEFTGTLSLNRKTDKDETTLKAEGYYASSDRKMDAQKWSALGRYAFSFGRDKKSYSFYRLEADHDRFANIQYRITPGIGLGRWLHDTEYCKFLVEIGAGAEYTNFRGATKDTTEPVVTPRFFFEKKVFDASTISQDVILYSSLEQPDEVRLHGETAFISPLNDKLSVKFSWINDYDTEPSQDSTRHDMRFISSLVYSF